jgi:SAM-dependent methyltransferase
MKRADWEQLYRSTPTSKLPWHSGAPDPALYELARDGVVKPCRALDLGCGQGTEAVFLSLAGFDVTGLDLSSAAVATARKLAKLLGAPAKFRQGDALKLPFRSSAFAFVADRGCFHMLPPECRDRWAAEASRVLKKGGRLFLRCFSDRAPRNYGPRCLTTAELRAALRGRFRILSMKRILSLGCSGIPVPLWAVLARKS